MSKSPLKSPVLEDDEKFALIKVEKLMQKILTLRIGNLLSVIYKLKN